MPDDRPVIALPDAEHDAGATGLRDAEHHVWNHHYHSDDGRAHYHGHAGRYYPDHDHHGPNDTDHTH